MRLVYPLTNWGYYEEEESHYKERTRIEPLSQRVQSILKQN